MKSDIPPFTSRFLVQTPHGFDPVAVEYRHPEGRFYLKDGHQCWGTPLNKDDPNIDRYVWLESKDGKIIRMQTISRIHWRMIRFDACCRSKTPAAWFPRKLTVEEAERMWNATDEKERGTTVSLEVFKEVFCSDSYPPNFSSDAK